MLAKNIPAFHAITVCDTNSYSYRAGKERVLKKLLDNPAKCTLLCTLGKNKVLSDRAGPLQAIFSGGSKMLC